MSGLRHTSVVVASLSIGDDEPLLRYGDLVVTRPPGAVEIDWELVAATVDPAPVGRGAHHLTMVTADRRTLAGDAILVRSIHGTHVFRGAGPIDGFDPTALD